jgi:hypothetical protein
MFASVKALSHEEIQRVFFCVVAAQKGPSLAYDSFLDETFLADQRTSLRQYLAENPNMMLSEPPEEFKERYSD